MAGFLTHIGRRWKAMSQLLGGSVRRGWRAEHDASQKNTLRSKALFARDWVSFRPLISNIIFVSNVQRWVRPTVPTTKMCRTVFLKKYSHNLRPSLHPRQTSAMRSVWLLKTLLSWRCGSQRWWLVIWKRGRTLNAKFGGALRYS